MEPRRALAEPVVHSSTPTEGATRWSLHTSSCFTRSLRSLCVRQAQGAGLEVVNRGFWGVAQAVEDGGDEVFRFDHLLHRFRGVFVGRPVHGAAANAAAGQG